jgi:integrase
MGRRRKHDRHLPARMYQRRGVYYYVDAGGAWRNLGRDYGAALIRYAEIVGERPQVRTVADLLAQYLEHASGRCKPATMANYRISTANLCRVFGAVAIVDVAPADVYRYVVTLGNVQANRDRALLSAAYTHARRTGALPAGFDDPTKGLHFRNPEEPRQRYVSDDEHAALMSAASPKLAVIQRFLYLTGMRQGDALRVRVADMDDEGIHYATGKTGARQVVTWTPELRACVDDAQRLWRRFGRVWLFESKPKGKHAARGVGPYTPSGLRALFRVARAKAGVDDVRLHDLRRKAGSDVDEAHAQELLGHTERKTTRKHYRAKPARVRPVK